MLEEFQRIQTLKVAIAAFLFKTHSFILSKIKKGNRIFIPL